MTLIKYNCLMCLLFIICSIYLLLYYSTYNGDQCLVQDNSSSSTTTPTTTTTDENSTSDSNSTTNNTTSRLRNLYATNISLICDIRRQLQDTTDVTSDLAAATDPTQGTKYTLIPLFQAIIYVLCFFFGIINVLGLNCFCDYEPDKFANLGSIKGCFSVIVRLMPGFVGFFHYVIFLLILIQFVLLNTENNCKNAEHENSDGTVSIGDMYDQGSFTNLVIFFIWIFCNFICPIYKASLPILPFAYAPVNYQASPVKRFLCYMGPM